VHQQYKFKKTIISIVIETRHEENKEFPHAYLEHDFLLHCWLLCIQVSTHMWLNKLWRYAVLTTIEDLQDLMIKWCNTNYLSMHLIFLKSFHVPNNNMKYEPNDFDLNHRKNPVAYWGCTTLSDSVVVWCWSLRAHNIWKFCCAGGHCRQSFFFKIKKVWLNLQRMKFEPEFVDCCVFLGVADCCCESYRRVRARWVARKKHTLAGRPKWTTRVLQLVARDT
jgi:hypothetical protein